MLQQQNDIIRQLEKFILPLQGYKAQAGNALRIGLGEVEEAFPNGIFPSGAIHECINESPSDAAAASGFMAGIIAKLAKQNSACVWISTARKIYPPALQPFGIMPHRVIFCDVQTNKDALWLMEEALKCEGLAAVIGEIPVIDFKSSRRLQLAVEKSRVTGFILRNNPKQLNTISAVARWKISPLPSLHDAPGVGFARWRVELLKVRNGRPGAWDIEWNGGLFHIIQPQKQTIWLNALSQYGSAI